MPSLAAKNQLVEKILCQPWHGNAVRNRALISSLLGRLKGDRPDQDVFGDKLPTMSIVGDVAVIPISGTLMINIPDWFKSWGGVTDANDIESDLNQALANPAVRLIVIDSDSPGGWSIAGDKLFTLVESANRLKPVLGWCADGADCCSSAYEAVAAARAVLVGPYAGSVGCIGSYLTFLDATEYWKNLGVVWEVFRSGDLKGLGIDGLSEDQKAFLQSTVDTAGAFFRANVSKYRTGIPRAEMEGQYYNGAESARRGFAAGTAQDLSAAIEKFRAMI